MKTSTILALNAASAFSAAPTGCVAPAAGSEQLIVYDLLVDQFAGDKGYNHLKNFKFKFVGRASPISCHADMLNFPDSQTVTCDAAEFTDATDYSFAVHTAMDGDDQYFLTITHKSKTGVTSGKSSIPLDCGLVPNDPSGCINHAPFIVNLGQSA